jgi:hypothetical protein
MNSSQNLARKRYALYALAILLLLLGGGGIYLGTHNYLIRALALVAIMASVHVARISHVHDRLSLPEASGRGKTARGPGRLLWIVSLALVPLLGASAFVLNMDAIHGGHEAWPVDVFAGVALACAGVWAALVSSYY